MAETEMRWDVLRAISGDEGKVKKYIEDYTNLHRDFARHMGGVLVPTEKVVINRNGKRVVKERNRFAGYVFVECERVGETQAVLRNVPSVLGFLSDSKNSTKPMPLRPTEVDYMLGTVDELRDVAESETAPYSTGEKVKVTDGPFTGFDAIIEEVNNEKKKLRASVKIFGRNTPVELGFAQVEKF